MQPHNVWPRRTHDLSRRDLLKAGLAAGVALSIGAPYRAPALGGEAAESPKPGGVLLLLSNGIVFCFAGRLQKMVMNY